MSERIKIAVLDDYQGVALTMADWKAVQQRADVTVFNDHLVDETEIINRLLPFEIVCVMRERTPLTRQILSQLPNLKLIISTGRRNASIDEKAVEELGITLKTTGYFGGGAPELTWAALMAIARNITVENANLRNGQWQTTISTDLAGKTIGIIGLGNIGTKIAAYANVFDMNVIAWSENLTEEKAAAAGAKLVSKETLLKEADFVTIHLVLSHRSRGIIGQADLDLMKPTAYFINTSRGPLVDEQALINTLQQKKIAGAAIDVYDIEPLPTDHPFRKLDNILATPHIGYVTEKTYKLFYEDMVAELLAWLNG
ncbi:D-2-hydroxyacid dehydrogenase family protein [Mucilaginibacter sp.]|uniref:D-2-hydroxyacid dehydrogenase family protein n=1 Tax=Mucilaginibacter sp. TaxID=1882438 RepID=UPI00261F5910|nr:D-2-hydroxyacid dehydrogenase family protein [Mucilaginibacter sp.]MDB4921391.1 hydroxyacid dehydrogenase [Mucilaginibacter sp.]